MTAPVLSPFEQDLVELLGTVDASRARTYALERQYLADIEVLYAERSAEESSPLVDAALLAAVVAVVRRALSAGVDEGALAAQAQFETLRLPTALFSEIEFNSADLGDQLVADLLKGQVEVARDPAKDRAVSVRELTRRASIAVMSALHFGRALATEESFKAAESALGTTLHKLWVARFDLDTEPCAACVRLHGVHVPLGKSFDIPKSEAAPYRKPFLGPPRHPNCRCSIVLYMPDSAVKGEATPLAMRQYSEWALSLSDEDRDNYVATTIVHVKAYTRMVDGQLQHVSGYYYNIQTGQKIPEGSVGSGMKVKQVSAKQAKAMAKVSKSANAATPKGGAPDLSWKPGTYKIDLPGGDDTQVVVHQDGSSTAIHKGQTEDNDKATTAQYLSAAKAQGLVQKISDDPEVPDPDGPGPVLEPDEDTNKKSTLAEGWYILTDHPSYGGVRVDADGNGKLFFKDFKQNLPLKPVSINQISNGYLGKFEEVDEKDFTSNWQKSFDKSKSSEDSKDQIPSSGAPSSEAPDSSPAEPGDARTAPAVSSDAPDFKSIPDVSIPDEPPLPADVEFMASGIAVLEPDGSVWIYEPKGHYAGYKHTWPKGGVDKDLSVQQSAHKELFEETGITADITGYLGDYKRSGTAGKAGGKVRIYVGTRKGGTPLPDDPTPFEPGGSETASVKNVSLDEALSLLNVNRDKRILKDVKEFGSAGRASAAAGSSQQTANALDSASDAPAVDAPNSAPDAPSVDVPGKEAAPPRSTAAAPSASSDSASPSLPEGGPGPAVAGGPSLFSVGKHSVQIEEGSQVYKSGKSKDTLYVLQPDGDLIKYNPQGAGVQATKVGSSENPAARAQLLAGLNNVTDIGTSIKNSMPMPGSGKALVGGFELTSHQIGEALKYLSANPSGNVAADLKRAGSPLAGGKFHEVAAPYKAYYNNKTKPALIAALKKAQAQTGVTPFSEAPAVAHMEESHGLDLPDVQLGLSDHEAIHQAMHAIDPEGSDHTHSPAAPGFISFGGVPVTPQAVAEALDALKSAPKAETGIKKPLKSIGSVLSGVNLQELANTSSITDQFKGSNGKVHYGKLKPAVIALLQDSLDKHQTTNPPVAPPAAVVPDPVKLVDGVSATQAQILEMQSFWSTVDLDANSSLSVVGSMTHNPLAYGVDWPSFASFKYGGQVPANELNRILHEGLNDYLDKKVPLAQVSPLPEVPADSSPEVSVGQLKGTVNQLKQYKAALDSSFTNVFSGSLPDSSPFKNVGLVTMSGQLGIGTEVPLSNLKSTVSDALQKKIDQTVHMSNFPPVSSGAVADTVSVAGVSVTKQDLLSAIAAVNASSTTGVKSPLKEIDSPLAKVDIKSYVEADPLSAPFKGSNGKVHYGKLKIAVVAVLQAKADGMASPAPDAPTAVPDVTPAGDADAPSLPDSDPNAFFTEVPVTSVSSSPQDQLGKLIDNAKLADPVSSADAFASAFQQAVKDDVETFAFVDPFDSFVSKSYSDVAGETHYSIAPDGTVFYVNENGDTNKLSELEVISKLTPAFESVGLDDDLAESNMPESGYYTTSGGMALQVFPDGRANVINTSNGTKVPFDDPSDVKTLIEAGSWNKISDTPQDPNKVFVDGIEVGTYSTGSGSSFSVFPDGTVLIENSFGKSSLANSSLLNHTIQADGSTPSALHTDKPDWAKDAKLDPNGFLLGEYAFGNEKVIVGPNGPDTMYAGVLAQYLFEGEVQYIGDGAPDRELPADSLPSLDDVEIGEASPAADIAPPGSWADSGSELYPDGTWLGHPVGTWTNGEDEYLEITEDGPQDDTIDSETILELIDSGDLTWVPSESSPQPSTPSSMVDEGTSKLSLVSVPGYTKFMNIDKPVLLDAVKKWAAESGFEGVAGQHINNATSKQDVADWLTAWANGEWDKAYDIEAKKVKSHKKKFVHPGSLENPANANGFSKKKLPPLIDGEVPAGQPVPGNWPAGTNYYQWQDDQVDAYILAANMQFPTGLNNYQKKKWVVAHISGAKYSTDSLSFLGQKNVNEGQIYSSPILPPVDKYAPGQAVPLPSDFPEIDYSKKSVSGWSNTQLDQYLNHVGPTKAIVDKLSAQSPDTKAQLVALHAVAAAPSGQTTFKDPGLAKQQMQGLLDTLQSQQWLDNADVTAAVSEAIKVEGKTFTLNDEQPPLGGGSSSEIFQVSDENGDQFLFKVAPEKFRAEVEHAGHLLAELSGIRVAPSQLGTFKGKFGQFQAKIPSNGTLKGVPATDLPLSALKDLMAAHVQDWATANDDAHGDNFLLMPDGKRVMPIDIARSFVRFGRPGSMSLKVGQLSNWTSPYYDSVYKAAINRKLSDADVDELYKASMKQARRTAAVSDEAWGGVIAEGLKNRPNFGWTSAKDLQDLVSQANARKNALPEDFENFWSGIYSSLGRDKPSAISSISKWVHSGFSPQFLENAEAMGNHGASTFFGGVDLEEGSMLGQVMQTSSGGKEFHLSGQLRKKADQNFRAWLAGNLSADLSGAVAESSTAQKKAQFLSDSGAGNYANHVLSAAKTVSHHNKLGDKNYNTSHMANYATMKEDVAKKLADASAGKFPTPFKDWPEAQREYVQLLEYYSSKLESVQQLIDFNGQSKIGDFDAYDVTLPPKKSIDSPIDLGDSLKVTKINSYFDGATLDDNNQLVLTGNSISTGQSGQTYQIELSDGTLIEYKSWHSAESVRRSQQGQLKIKVKNYDGSTAGIDNARAALSQMGLNFEDATEEDLELFYYRHLYSILQDRVDKDSASFKEIVDDVKANLPGGGEGTPALDAAEELKRWRKAWSRLDPARFNTFLAEKKWMPKFHRANPSAPDQRGGQPYWERFDVDPEWLKSRKPLVHSLSDPSVALNVVKSGGLLSTEDRMKLLGQWFGGMSSTSDQASGSSNFVFTRQNIGTGSYQQVYINPRVLKRTTNYSFPGDYFGEINSRSSSSYFDLKKASSHTGGNNELLLKRMASLLDDLDMLLFSNPSDRQEAINFLKSKGVTEIRGLPIEDRLVLSNNKTAAWAKIQAHEAQWEEGYE